MGSEHPISASLSRESVGIKGVFVKFNEDWQRGSKERGESYTSTNVKIT